MSRHIGIVGCSIDGAALCYRTVCLGAAASSEHAHLEISVHNMPWPEYLLHIRNRDWQEVARLMLASAGRLAKAGAEILICPDNTVHEALGFVTPDSPGVWLHIGEVVIDKAIRNSNRRLGVLGTKQLMNGPVYREIASRCGIALELPPTEDQQKIDRIIFEELNKDQFTEASRRYLYRQIEQFKARGCDAVILGCTELPLMVEASDSSLPTLDSTRLLAKAALRASLQ